MAFRRRKHSSEQEFPSNETSAKEGGGNRDDVEQAPSTSQRTSFQSAISSKYQQSIPKIEYKFDIASRLDDSVSIKLVNAPNRSPDLIPLTKSFDAMRKRLRQLISSAKQYHKSMNVLDMDRLQMAKEMSAFAEGSPIESFVGNVDENSSFLSVYCNASNQCDRSSLKFKNDVLDYCVEWEAVITSRVDKDLDITKKLRESYNHYLNKVDALRKKVNGQETKGKSVNDSLAEKLQRNVEKLDDACSAFEAAARKLCVMIEEVVLYGWKDLYPMIQATMKFEMHRSHQEARMFQSFQCDALENAFREQIGSARRPGVFKQKSNSSSFDSKRATRPKATKTPSTSSQKTKFAHTGTNKHTMGARHDNNDVSDSSSSEPDERSNERKFDSV